MKRLSFRKSGFILVSGIIFLFALQSCGTADADVQSLKIQVTSLAGTLSAMQTSSAIQQTAAVTPVIETPLPTSTPSPTPTAVPQEPTVITDALCWLGPGPGYEVVSSIKSGTQVELLGTGNVAGWWVVLNPRYHDPCWIEQSVMQVDPNIDLSSLTVYSAPPLWFPPPPMREPPPSFPFPPPP